MRENRRRYGARRIKAALQKSGTKVGRAVVRRLMNEQNLKAIQPKSCKPKTTNSKGTLASLNLLEAVRISECAVGKIIIGDITYLPLRNGKWCYLAVWQDKVTRRIVGWNLAETMTAELDVGTLKKATLKGLVQAGAIIHSNRGSQYATKEFRTLLQVNCFRQSMRIIPKIEHSIDDQLDLP